MNKTALALLERGDISGLLALHAETFGTAAMTAPDQPPAPDVIRVPAAPPAPPAPNVQTFTAEDIERARQQEKDKLYPELQTLRQQQEEQAKLMQTFQAEREERERLAEEAQAQAAAAAEEKRLAELGFKEQLAEFQQQTLGQVQTLQEQIAQRDALIEKERQFTELMQYRGAALQSELGEQIIPELRDLVAGNTREEIDSSISALAQRSASILQQVAQATQQTRQGARGVGVTAPPVGPMDNNSGYETVTREDIANMDMQTYAQNRGRLLGAASQQQRDRGMFG